MTAPGAAAPAAGPGRIELAEVTRLFAGVKAPALDAITATLPEGRITGLVGPDGAGKTTLMRIMAGLLLAEFGQGVRRRPRSAHPRARTAYADRLHAAKVRAVRRPERAGRTSKLHADLRGVVGPERHQSSSGCSNSLICLVHRRGWPGALGRHETEAGAGLRAARPAATPAARRTRGRRGPDLPPRTVEDGHGAVGQGSTVVWSTAYLDEAEVCAQVLLLDDGQLLYAGNPPT